MNGGKRSRRPETGLSAPEDLSPPELARPHVYRWWLGDGLFSGDLSRLSDVRSAGSRDGFGSRQLPDSLRRTSQGPTDELAELEFTTYRRVRFAEGIIDAQNVMRAYACAASGENHLGAGEETEIRVLGRDWPARSAQPPCSRSWRRSLSRFWSRSMSVSTGFGCVRPR